MTGGGVAIAALSSGPAFRSRTYAHVAGRSPHDVYTLGGDHPAEIVFLAHFDGGPWARERSPEGSARGSR